MRERFSAFLQHRLLHLYNSQRIPTDPSQIPLRQSVISIDGATFYRRYPLPADDAAPNANPALFPNLNFALPASKPGNVDAQCWSIVSPSSLARTTFLQILGGQHICVPATARSFPHLSQLCTSPQHAIKYVGFDAERGSDVNGSSVRGSYLSARYESRREKTDFSVLDYLTGHTELNALESKTTNTDRQLLREVVSSLNLEKLLDMPVSNLSNGQTRRARIAKALMARPEVLLLDGPFMGLDPNTLVTMAEVLRQLVERQSPRLVMSLRPEDETPEWISHLVIADERLNVLVKGCRQEILSASEHRPEVQTILAAAKSWLPFGRIEKERRDKGKLSKDGFLRSSPALPAGQAVVEMAGVKVSYGANTVLGGWRQVLDGETKEGLWWSLHRGQRCGIFGPNGSGKTTMLSLITSDHPQTYSLPIRLFGRSRLPEIGEPGMSVFDIQRKMGHSSPEVHAFFPKRLTVRRTLESAWADTPLIKPGLTREADARVTATLRWFARELNPDQSVRPALEEIEATLQAMYPQILSLGGEQKERLAFDAAAVQADASTRMNAEERFHELAGNEIDLDWTQRVRFGELSFSSQRLLLFLRAIVAQPDLVILDEALSGIDECARDKALLFLSHGQKIKRVQDGVIIPSLWAKMDTVVCEGLSEQQALLVISHAKEDVPGCLREWICLPEPGEGRPPRTGILEGPLELNPHAWDSIWGRTS